MQKYNKVVASYLVVVASYKVVASLNEITVFSEFPIKVFCNISTDGCYWKERNLFRGLYSWSVRYAIPLQQIECSISDLRSDSSSKEVFFGQVSLTCAAAYILLDKPHDELYSKLRKSATPEPRCYGYEEEDEESPNFSQCEREALIQILIELRDRLPSMDLTGRLPRDVPRLFNKAGDMLNPAYEKLLSCVDICTLHVHAGEKKPVHVGCELPWDAGTYRAVGHGGTCPPKP